MSNYAILRCAKLKSGGEVKSSLSHAFRDRETANADASLTPENSHFGAETAEAAFAAYKDLLPDKVRKNGVHCIEYLITGSPEAINGKGKDAQDAYFKDALEWLRERHGAENVVYAGVHRDETTPHFYAYAVPIDEKGKLNCSAFLDGRKMLSEMQTEFADRVGEKHGLERGVEGSKATHERVKRYYSTISDRSRGVADMELPKLDKKLLSSETSESHAKRVKKAVLKRVEPDIARGWRAKEAEQKAEEAERTARTLSKEALAQRELTKGLDAEDKAQLERVAAQLREKRAAEKKAERDRKKQERGRDQGR